MTPATLNAPRRAAPMQGPHFAVGRVSQWMRSAAEASLTFDDGSRWRLAWTTPNAAAIADLIDMVARRGQKLFVSGDRDTGLIDRVDAPGLFLPRHVAAEPRRGRLNVFFFGHPSIYHLRVDRPWFDRGAAVLRQRCARLSTDPDLLVSTDIVTMEIMDVRPWGPGTG